MVIISSEAVIVRYVRSCCSAADLSRKDSPARDSEGIREEILEERERGIKKRVDRRKNRHPLRAV